MQGNGIQGHAPRCGDITVTGEHLPALRSRSMDAAMATQIRTGNVIVVRYADDSVFGFKSEEPQMLLASADLAGLADIAVHC